MIIHTVKAGDTVFKIAREHSTSPMKIIENNELENPDRLVVGQKLLILTPTRTYNVRGSDTLGRVADRFGVKYKSLLAKNPYLAGTNKIYPGQLLSIKYDAPKYGMAAANGYCYKGFTRDRLDMVAPYLTYLTVGAGKRDGDDIRLTFDDTEPLSFAKENGIIPLFRIYDGGCEFSDKYIDSIILMATTHGYRGVTLASYTAMKKEPEKFREFSQKLKSALREQDMPLFLELDGNEKIDLPKVAFDGYVIMYEKCPLESIPSFEAGEERMMRSFAQSGEAQRAYMDIATLGYMGDEEIRKSDFERLAYTSGKNIEYDEKLGICHFEYNKYKNGKGESVKVRYEAPENVKAKLSLVGELGFMGISFDIMSVPVEYLMMFETMFSHPEL